MKRELDTIEKAIYSYFATRPRPIEGARPSEEDFYLFVLGELKDEPLKVMLAHLAGDPEDRALVRRLRAALGAEADPSEASLPDIPESCRERAKALMPGVDTPSCPHCGKGITPFKKPLRTQRRLNLLWLVLAAGSFATSFYVHRYFIQFVVLGLVCALKWIVESRNTKTQVLIYKALEESVAEREGGSIQRGERTTRV